MLGTLVDGWHVKFKNFISLIALFYSFWGNSSEGLLWSWVHCFPIHYSWMAWDQGEPQGLFISFSSLFFQRSNNKCRITEATHEPLNRLGSNSSWRVKFVSTFRTDVTFRGCWFGRALSLLMGHKQFLVCHLGLGFGPESCPHCWLYHHLAYCWEHGVDAHLKTLEVSSEDKWTLYLVDSNMHIHSYMCKSE